MLIAFLEEWGDGVWPPAAGSGLCQAAEFLDSSVSAALDVVEAAERRVAS